MSIRFKANTLFSMLTKVRHKNTFNTDKRCYEMLNFFNNKTKRRYKTVQYFEIFEVCNNKIIV